MTKALGPGLRRDDGSFFIAPHAARRTPHAARRTPHAARRTPHAARRQAAKPSPPPRSHTVVFWRSALSDGSQSTASRRGVMRVSADTPGKALIGKSASLS